MPRLKITANLAVIDGTPPINVTGNIYVYGSNGSLVWQRSFSDVFYGTGSKSYTYETGGLSPGDYDVHVTVDLSNSAGRTSLSQRARGTITTTPGGITARDAISRCIGEDGIPVAGVRPDTDVSPYVLDGLRPAGGYYIQGYVPGNQFREGSLKWSVDVFSARGHEGAVFCYSKIYPKELPSTCMCPEGYQWDRWAGMCCSTYGCKWPFEKGCFRRLSPVEAKKYFPGATITEGCECYVPCGSGPCLWHLFPVGWTCSCR
jgi:hypothetical protein